MRQRHEVFGTRAKRGRGRRFFGVLITVSALIVAGLAGFGPDRARADQANGVAGAPRIAAGKLSAAYSGGTCAVRPSGGVRCWGNHTTAGTFAGASLDVDGVVGGSAAQIAMDDGKLCVLSTTGAVNCSGDTAGYTPTLPAGSATMLTVAGPGYCFLTAAGGVRCSGPDAGTIYGTFRWTGGGTLTTDVPFDVVPGVTVTAVASSVWNTCALFSTGGVRCFGAYDYDLSGAGINAGSSLTADVPGLPAMESIALSGNAAQACGIAIGTQLVHCWGRYSYPSTPLPIGPATSVSVSAVKCAVLISGQIRCWDREYGSAGDPTNAVALGPDRDGNPAIAVAVSVGSYHICAPTPVVRRKR
jgi:hypothetical protein